MARLHWRPDICRRHTRPARSQRPPDRSRRRELETPTSQIDPKGLTTDRQLAKNLPAERPPARRHHLVSPGDIISESVGDFVGICMRRRDFIILLAGATGEAPSAVCAQQKTRPAIGFLSSASPRFYAPYVAALQRGLDDTGYVEGQNVAIEYRWAEGRYERLPALAA